jgi:ribosomal-protein-alanine N-acetyltransferase
MRLMGDRVTWRGASARDRRRVDRRGGQRIDGGCTVKAVTPQRTERLELIAITLPMVEAVLAGDRGRAEDLAGAAFPYSWPGEQLIARAFPCSIEAIRADPDRRLWGDRLLVTADGDRRVVGSVVFHGLPGDGIAEVGYGVEESSQGLGFATEGTAACVRWALAQAGIREVTATTFPWHKASLRVIEKVGMQRVDTREHETLGELWVFSSDPRARAAVAGRVY